MAEAVAVGDPENVSANTIDQLNSNWRAWCRFITRFDINGGPMRPELGDLNALGRKRELWASRRGLFSHGRRVRHHIPQLALDGRPCQRRRGEELLAALLPQLPRLGYDGRRMPRQRDPGRSPLVL
eukprot:scaffold27133_cov78-Phaeocystis_antarctica.AAC.1